MQVNPMTGLKEERHSFYNSALVHQRSLGTLKFGGQQTAVHTIPLKNGLTLDFFAQLKSSDELVITLMGANTPAKNFYPKFARVSSMRGRAPAMIAFADSTLRMDPDQQMLLSWYLGGPAFDPALPILRVIKRAQGKTGAKHVAFTGGSGGGFAALRISSMLPGSLAFVQEPQTSIERYIDSVVERYFNNAWPGWDRNDLMEAFPERFDMVRHYAQRIPQNFVYYCQSVADRPHVENHYKPFKQAMGLKSDSGVSPNGRMKFSLYEGEIHGHGKITRDEYDHHYNEAMKFWRAGRASM